MRPQPIFACDPIAAFHAVVNRNQPVVFHAPIEAENGDDCPDEDHAENVTGRMEQDQDRIAGYDGRQDCRPGDHNAIARALLPSRLQRGERRSVFRLGESMKRETTAS